VTLALNVPDQLVTGVALLLNRYVPLALVVSAALLYNILAFHITMFPAGIVPGLILTVCWVVLALSMHERLAPLLGG
jgi:putative oxidoreductase